MEFINEIPIITRVYAAACFLTTLACRLKIVNAFHLYFNLSLIVKEFQFWRLITNFLYFGDFGIDFIFHMFFLVRYSRELEQGSFRGRPADFLYMLILGATIMNTLGPLVTFFGPLPFFGSALTFMMVYVWAQRNPLVRMGFLHVFYFRAPFLPWVLLGVGLLLDHNPAADLIGIAVGHIYFFLEDVYAKPKQNGGLGGPRVLQTPGFIKALFEGPVEIIDAPPEEERAGGFQWGQPQQQQQQQDQQQDGGVQ